MARDIKERAARQGFWDRPVLYVLGGGLILAALYLVVLTGWTLTSSDAEIGDVDNPATTDGATGSGEGSGTGEAAGTAEPAD